jgi:cell division protein FtsI (penicillin-binding protein 3)
MSSVNSANKTLKIALYFLFFLFFLAIFLFAAFRIVVEDRKIPRLVIQKESKAVSGSIISADGYQVAYSNKHYKVSFKPRYIDPLKKDLFVNILHIYTDIPEKEIEKKIAIGNGKGKVPKYVTLGASFDINTAKQLRQLSKVLISMGVFRPYIHEGKKIWQGLTIEESGEYRHYPYKETLTPVIGYVRKKYLEDMRYIVCDRNGTKGIEKYYEKQLRPKQDGRIRGRRDVGNNIIFNKNTLIKRRIDGFDVHLHIDLGLQKSLERILDSEKKRVGAREVIAAVMESDSGHIISMATTNRYDPSNIKKNDTEALNAKVVEYNFEPGSVMKPIVFSLLLEHGLVDLNETILGFGGRFRIGKKTIMDEHPFDQLSAKDVIVHSSNIGMAQLAQRLPYDLYYQGLKRFGFSQPTGIDLPFENSGKIQPMQRLKHAIYKATTSYGYGIDVTFMQLLYAYNSFNNGGKGITPRIADHFSDWYGRKWDNEPQHTRQVLTPHVADTMREVLKEVVQKGTGKAAQIEGVEIGGKTGTAMIAKKGGKKGYEKKYHASFFGFANDKYHRYTIGVLVIRPLRKYHFASQSAVPVFRRIVQELIDRKYLTRQR